MSPNPTLIRPRTASALEAIGAELEHDSPDETITTLLEYLAQQAADGEPEQLAEQLSAASSTSATPSRTERDELAESAMTLSDLRAASQSGLSPAELLAERYGVTVDATDDAEHLRREVSEKRAELKEQTSGRGPTV